jgi:hypothetical protein
MAITTVPTKQTTAAEITYVGLTVISTGPFLVMNRNLFSRKNHNLLFTVNGESARLPCIIVGVKR